MYVEIKDNKLLSWCENPYLDYAYVDIDYQSFEPEKYSVIDGILTNITDTQEYKAKIEKEERNQKLDDLNSQIEILDRKRIRAIAEPSLRDTQSGQTWLEYYTQEIISLRAQISTLQAE